MLFLGSEQHAHVRRIVMKAFTPRAIARVTPVTRDIAAALIGEVAADHHMDIVEQFAYRLPLRVIAYILKLNGFAPGADSLKADSTAMRHIRIGMSQRADTAKPPSR